MALASLLLLIALVLAVCASAGINAGRVSLLALSFAFYLASVMVAGGALS